MEAYDIINLHKALEYAFPKIEIVWHPSNSNLISFDDTFFWDGDEFAFTIFLEKKFQKNEIYVIHLTIHPENPKYIYFVYV